MNKQTLLLLLLHAATCSSLQEEEGRVVCLEVRKERSACFASDVVLVVPTQLFFLPLKSRPSMQRERESDEARNLLMMLSLFLSISARRPAAKIMLRNSHLLVIDRALVYVECLGNATGSLCVSVCVCILHLSAGCHFVCADVMVVLPPKSVCVWLTFIFGRVDKT